MYADNNIPAPAKTPPVKSAEAPRWGEMDTEVQFVPGVGPNRGRQLERVGIRTVEDLLYYLPRRYLDRSLIMKIQDLDLSDREVTVVGRVTSFKFIGGGPNSRRFELVMVDGTGMLTAVWFQGLNYWTKAFERGQIVAFSGKVGLYRERVQMVHPAVDFLDEIETRSLKAKTGTIISLYSSDDGLTKVGLDSRGFRRIMADALTLVQGKIPEILPAEILKKHQLTARELALYRIHFPEDLYFADAARRRLKYEESFLIQLTLALRQHRRRNRAIGVRFPHPGKGGLTAKAVKLFPFELTQGQKDVLREIRLDMESPHPMNRLLQGDVGAGKTAIAMLAICMALEGSYQGAIMAPTEVLAEQHFRTMQPFYEKLGIKTAMLIGGLQTSLRKERLAQIKSGQARVIIGTHALIQEGVDFARLGLVIIDEQHRFGVAQRLELRLKGAKPDVLVMTATPIPRSLALTIYGDLDVSILNERPSQRRPIVTRILDGKRREELYAFLRTELSKSRQGFIIYPLVEESEKLDLQAATKAYEQLKAGPLKDFRLGLLHGRMATEEKDRTMAAFSAGQIDLLVSTVVVEVGIDIPNATVMAVMGAQRFGLSQLHQLRGRVGRGIHRGVCVLVVDPPMTKEAKDRLAVLERTEDGFIIAEEDLRIRGGGEFFGTRQSGAPDFKIADPIVDRQILEQAREDAFAWAEKDPELKAFAPLRSHFEKAFGARMVYMDIG